MSLPVSRILLKMAIYLGGALPPRSSHLPGETGPVIFPSTVLLRIEFTAANCRQNAGRSLTPPFHPYCKKYAAVYLCCTCPDVAIGGCYPLSLPCGARTFLTHSLSAHARGHSENSLISKNYTKYAVLYSSGWICVRPISGRALRFPPMTVRSKVLLVTFLSRKVSRPGFPSCARRFGRPRCPRTRPASSACSSCRPQR